MAPITDEQALRSALHEMSLGQPDAPVDRMRGIRRRHARRLAVQGGVALAAVVAAIAGLVTSVGGSIGSHPQPLKQPDPKAWQLTWPVRYGDNSDSSIARGRGMQQTALDYYRTRLGPALRDVRVLYAARPSGLAADWVVIEGSTGSPETHQLIALASADNDSTWS